MSVLVIYGDICIKGLIRKFTEIHILTIQSGVNKRNKNRGEHSVIKHKFSIHSYISVIAKLETNPWPNERKSGQKTNPEHFLPATSLRKQWPFLHINKTFSTHLWGSRYALKGKVEYVWSYTTYIWLPWYFFITGM
jgi:hypothetical protein